MRLSFRHPCLLAGLGVGIAGSLLVSAPALAGGFSISEAGVKVMYHPNDRWSFGKCTTTARR